MLFKHMCMCECSRINNIFNTKIEEFIVPVASPIVDEDDDDTFNQSYYDKLYEDIKAGNIQQ